MSSAQRSVPVGTRGPWRGNHTGHTSFMSVVRASQHPSTERRGRTSAPSRHVRRRERYYALCIDIDLTRYLSSGFTVQETRSTRALRRICMKSISSRVVDIRQSPTYKFYKLPASTLGAGRQTRRGNAQEVQRTAMPISIQLDRLDLEVKRDQGEDQALMLRKREREPMCMSM